LERIRREPYRLLFPLGAVLAGTGVVPWVAFSLRLTQPSSPVFQLVGFRAIFHPLVEVEAVLGCFATGFLFTSIPRWTGSLPPSRWQLGLALSAPLAIVACAALNRWGTAQLFWLALLAMASEFTLRRIAAARLLRPRAIWVAAGLAMGVAGALLAGLRDALPAQGPLIYDLGRDLLLQGCFTGLVLGTASAVARVPAAEGEPARTAELVLHGLGALALVGSFWLGAYVSQPLAFAARAAVTLAAVLGPIRWSGLPRGLRRGMMRMALLLLPVGNAWLALWPAHRRAGLHVIYLGCFATLAMVLTGSMDEKHLVRSDELALAGGLLAFSLATRILLELDPRDFYLWLGMASISFLFAAPLWAALTRRA
jgi:hypothetical protein